MKSLLFFFFSLIVCVSCQDNVLNESITVTSMDELNTAIDKAKAGDVIVMKNGVWKDAAIKFYGMGTDTNNIILKAETPGGVILEGNSSLKLGGEYLQVSGLHFKNGYTSESAVIRFKINNEKIAYHSRVTDCVIEDFADPDRDSKNHWIELWGNITK